MHIKFRTKKSLGQNFIFDENILNKIVSHLGLTKDSAVLEIGSGLGTLTNFLIKNAGEVIALEIDRRAVEVLRDRFRDEKNIEIVNQDILKYVIPARFVKQKLIVVGNIPFYITSPIIERLFGFRDRIGSIFLTVQKEVARRIVAKPSTKDCGALTCFVRYHSRPEILFDIKAGSFSPAPKVDAAFVKLEILKKSYYDAKKEGLFFKMVRGAFSQRRKTIVNALSHIYKKEETASAIKYLGFNPNVRIENLSLGELMDLFNRLSIISA